MKLEGIINVSGKSGLHKIVSKGKNSIIVESLIDKKRMPVYSHINANSLEEIGIYTYKDTIPLVDVFIKIAKKTKCSKCISHNFRFAFVHQRPLLVTLRSQHGLLVKQVWLYS